MYPVTATVTFTHGTAVNFAAALGIDRCAKIVAEPDSNNSHVSYVGDASLALGTSTVNHVIKLIAQPPASTVPLDKYEHQDHNGGNQIELAQFSTDGTTNEKMRLTAYVR